MIRWILDTDHLSLHEHGHPALRRRLDTVPPDDLAVSVITVEEMIRGRLAMLARRSDGVARVHAYAKFLDTVLFFGSIPVLPFDLACEQQFQALRAQRLGIGTQDLRIAATALVARATVVTRNRQDFEHIPGLNVEDWTIDA